MIYDLRFAIYDPLPDKRGDAESAENRRDFGLRREAKRHAALESRLQFAMQRRCRRCTLPPQSTGIFSAFSASLRLLASLRGERRFV